MDFKDFHDGMLSSSLLMIVFSITLLFGTILLKPYIALEPEHRDLIVIISSIPIFFSPLYFIASLRVKKIFKLDIKNILKFLKTIGILNIIFTPHIFFLLSLLMLELHELQILMILLNAFIEGILIGIVYKQVYDLLLKNDAERKFEIEKNQKYYYKG